MNNFKRVTQHDFFDYCNSKKDTKKVITGKAFPQSFRIIKDDKIIAFTSYDESSNPTDLSYHILNK